MCTGIAVSAGNRKPSDRCFGKHLPIIDGNGDYTISILEKLSGDKKEKEPDKKGLTVCIDAGHGGKDNGSDYKNRYEKDDTLAMALAVQSYLQEKDVNVIMTRSMIPS